MSSAMALRRSDSRSQTLSLFEGAGGEPTLDDVLAGVWEGLAARANASCPICGERMEPVVGTRRQRAPGDGQRAPGDRGRAPEDSEPTPGGARCTSCGSSLS